MKEFMRSVPMLVAAMGMFTVKAGSVQFAIIFSAFAICSAISIAATLADKQ